MTTFVFYFFQKLKAEIQNKKGFFNLSTSHPSNLPHSENYPQIFRFANLPSKSIGLDQCTCQVNWCSFFDEEKVNVLLALARVSLRSVVKEKREKKSQFYLTRVLPDPPFLSDSSSTSPSFIYHHQIINIISIMLDFLG